VSETKQNRVVILGATSAMAEAVARIYAQEGAAIALAGRNAERLDIIAADLSVRGAAAVPVFALDLATADVGTNFEAMVKALGGVEHVLIFYGVLGDQQQAEGDLALAEEWLRVNFTSAALWSLAAAQRLERQGYGSLVVVGSVAGDRGRQSNYVYGAAKAGLATLVQGIAHRFALKRGRALRAVVVKPGFVDTPMTDGLKKGGLLWATPETVAVIIRKAADRGGPIVYAPWFWRPILWIIRFFPSALFHRLPL